MGSRRDFGELDRRIQSVVILLSVKLQLLMCLTDDWNRESHPMQRDQYGVWELTLPAKNGQTAIPHNTKVKVRLMAHLSTSILMLQLADFNDQT